MGTCRNRLTEFGACKLSFPDDVSGDTSPVMSRSGACGSFDTGTSLDWAYAVKQRRTEKLDNMSVLSCNPKGRS